jgi:biopolymer transport protein ExbB
MIRPVLILLAAALLLAAEASPVATVQAAREAAEARLAEQRGAIHAEQARLLASLQEAVAAGTAARERLAAATAAASAASAEAARRAAEQERGLALVRQLADRAMVAARLPEAEQRRLATATPAERVAAAIANLERRLAALPTRLALRLGDETVIGRDGRLASVPVLRLGEARAVALGAADAQRGLLERAADGASWLVVGPSLPAAVLPREGAVATIALDAAGSAAHQAGAVHRTFAEWLAAGRAFIWPIIAVFAIGLLIAVERTVALARSRVDPRRLVAVADHLARGDAVGARQLVGLRATPLDRVLGAGLDALARPREAREAAVEQALIGETGQLNRGLTAIAVLAGVAPLLGLLGTVTGMIDMFSVIAAQGSGNARSLSGGISEALICTQAGMLAAIPLLLAHAWLGRIADRRSQVLEEAACGVLGLVEHGDPRPAVPVRP